MADPREYYYFYLLGRQDDEFDVQVDITALAERVLSGEAIRDVCTQVAADAAVTAQHGGHKRDWLIENRDEIAEAGGNGEHAYDLYLDGQKDQFASSLEPDILDELRELLDDIDLSERGGGSEEAEDEGDDDEEDDEGEETRSRA